MSSSQTATRGQQDKLLEDSIDRRLRTVVTQRLPDGWRTYKSSFESGTSASGMMVLKLIVPNDTEEVAWPRADEPLGVAFRLGHKKCMFSTVAQASETRDGETYLRVTWPKDLKTFQRRVFDRVAPPRGTIVPVRFWAEEHNASTTATARNVHNGQLEDLSAGGMRVKTGDLSNIQLGGTYRCVFTAQPGSPTLILDTVLRHREATDSGRASLGFHFLGLEMTPEGRKLLDRIVHIVKQFQRTRNRRRRKPSTQSET